MSEVAVFGADATHANISHLPKADIYAGYITEVGTGSGIEWTAEDFARFAPMNVVKIGQLPHGDPPFADVLDYENGAATDPELVRWSKAALLSYHSNAHPGQRSPAVYASRSQITHVVNTLIAGGIHGGIGLGIADFNNDPAEAQREIETASGPFPVIWRQYANRGPYDVGFFSRDWLNNVSTATPNPAVPPGQWENPKDWTWAQAAIVGVGLDGKLHAFEFDKANNRWVKVT
jgi:hypothetical protein